MPDGGEDGNVLIVVHVMLQVLATNQNGDALAGVQNSSLFYGPGAASDKTPWSFVTSTPSLVITQSFTPVAGGYAGENISYLLQISDAGANNSAPSYNLTVSQLLPEGFVLVPGTLVVTGPSGVSLGNVSVISGNASGDAGVTVHISGPYNSSAGPINITFQAVVDQSVQIGSSIAQVPLSVGLRLPG